jgi:hypothetical protein
MYNFMIWNLLINFNPVNKNPIFRKEFVSFRQCVALYIMALLKISTSKKKEKGNVLETHPIDTPRLTEF